MDLNDETLMSTLRSVIAAAPATVYAPPNHMRLSEIDPTCFYVHTDTDGAAVAAGCVVGHVLNELGIPLSELMSHEGATAHNLLHAFAPDASAGTQDFFRSVQSRQDGGTPWGIALSKTEGVYA